MTASRTDDPKVLKQRILDLETALDSLRGELDHENNLNRVVLGSIPESVFILDREFRFVYVNPIAAVFSGLEENQLLGCKLTDVFPDIERTKFLKTFRSVMRTRKARTVEDEFIFPDGRRGWYEVRVSPESHGILCVSRDITGRRKHETALLKSRERYNRLFEDATVGIAVAEAATGLITEVNEAFCRLTGYESVELIGRPQTMLHPPENGKPAVSSSFERHRKSESGEVLTVPLIRKTGELLQVEIKAGPVKIDGVESVQAYFRDVSEEFRSRREREFTLELMRLMREPNHVHEFVRLLTGYLQRWSGCEAVGVRLQEGDDFPYFETRGFPPEFVRAENFLCVPDTRGQTLRDSRGNPVLECMCGNVILGRTDPSLPFFTANGSFWTNSTSALLASTSEQDRQARTRNRCNGEGYESVALIPLHSGQRTLGLLQFNDRRKDLFTPELIGFLERAADRIAVSLTERQAKAAFRASESRLRAIMDSSLAAIVLHDRAGTILECNEECARRFGMKMEELKGKIAWDYMSPEVIGKRKALLEQVFAEGKPVNSEDERSGFWNDYNIYPVFAEDGSVSCAAVYSLNITERKRAEQALRESEEKFRTLVQSNNSVILRWKRGGEIVFINDHGQEFFGFSEQEILGRNVVGTIVPEFEENGRDLAAMIDDIFLRPESYDKNINQNITKDGRRVWISWTNKAILDEKGRVVEMFSIGQDITERKLADDRIKLMAELLDTIPACVTVHDFEGNFLYINQRAMEYHGYSKEEFLSLKMYDLDVPESAALVESRLKLLAEKGEASFEVAHYRKDGSILPLMINARFIDWSGTPVILSIATDITERKRNEQELMRATNLLSAIREAQEAFISDRDPEPVFKGLLETMVSLTSSEFGFLDEVISDENGELYKKSLCVSDVSWDEASRKIYRELTEGGLKFRNLDNLAGMPAITGKLIIANDAAHDSRRGGLPKGHPAIKTFMGIPLFFGGELVGVMGVANRPEGYSEVIASFLDPFTTTCAGLINAIRIQKKEREHLEALRENALWLEEATRAGNVGLWDWDLKTNRVKYSREWKRQVGFEEHEISDTFEEWSSRVHPEDLAATTARINAFIADDIPEYNLEFRFRHRNGSYLWILTHATIIHDGNGRAVRVVGSHVDITGHKNIENALAEETVRRRILVEQSRDGIVVLDADGKVYEANRSFAGMLGYSAEEVLQLHVWDWDNRWTREHLLGMIREVGESGDFFETRHRRKDGSAIEVEISTNGVVVSGRKLVFCVCRDITERKKAEFERLELERRLLHKQKLESLGVLAGGIAHDFNNLLMAVLGNLDIAMLDLAPSSGARGPVEQAVKASRRAADLTRQMLAYAGRGQFVIKELDLSELVKENVQLFRASISKTVSLNLFPAAQASSIKADPGQVQQVVMNLITNASDAIGDKPGEITLRTGSLQCDKAYLAGSRIEEKPDPGLFAFVEISDTGCGMDEETLQRLFDPFFTTKFIGRGLGMASVLGIVRGHKGAILVESSVGTGTVIRVLFPANEIPEPKKFSTSAPQPKKDARAGRDAILLADDDQSVRTVTESFLQRLGYRVIAAEDGVEAVELFRKHGDEIGCVVLDQTMPRMDGLTAFREMRKLSPNIKAILVSGFDSSDTLERYSGEGLTGFIQKPFHVRDLKEKLEEVLEIAG